MLALKVRREKDYTEILLRGLRYPLPAVAKRATEAMAKLEQLQADMAEFVSDGGDLRPVEPRLVPGFMQPVPIVALGVAEPITGTHEIIAS